MKRLRARSILTVALAATGALGCGAGTRSPVGAVRALSDAVQLADRAKVGLLLGPQTRRRLAERGRVAGEVAGRRAPDPSDMLALGWGPPRYRVASVSEVNRVGDQAQVEVRGPGGERDLVECVYAGEGWRVELP